MTLEEEECSDCVEFHPKGLVTRVKSKHLVTLNVMQSASSYVWFEKLFLRNTCGLNNMIPRSIMGVDEKYLRHCLEMVNVTAANMAATSISLMLSLSEKTRPNLNDLSIFEVGYPLAIGSDNLVGSPGRQQSIGSIADDRSMINILNSPLFRKFGVLENSVNFGKNSSSSIQGLVSSDNTSSSSPSGLAICSSHNLKKDNVILVDRDNDLKNAILKMPSSISSTIRSCLDQHSTPTFVSISQGMIRCTRKCGIPHFVLTIDDTKEIYVADLLNAESSHNKTSGTYLFHSGMSSERKHEMHIDKSSLIAKMGVTTSSTLYSNNSRVTETEFVLFAAHETHTDEAKASSKALTKKVAKVFKSKFGSMNTLSNHCTSERRTPFTIDNCVESNDELAAIVIKQQQLYINSQAAEIGGWGLNFLKKARNKSTSTSGCCLKNTSECSTSVDIIVPAGIHGWPRTINGGPSSLIERWRSKGQCDCGGWDIGCPITVFNNRSSEDDDRHRSCKSSYIFIRGKKDEGAPTMKLMNVEDGLYNIHFQSSLSPLQSFSIAVAIIHTQAPQLKPEIVYDIK